MSGKFGTAINCMDGRTQLPVINFLKENFGLDYVDVITEPGPNKILAENKNQTIVESIKKRVEISVAKHNSKLIAIVGHYDCAGNPVDIDLQIEQIMTACQTIKNWGFDVLVVGLFVDNNFKVQQIK